MNKKNKGFTTIELITSFTLASVIMIILFNIILILKDNLSEVNAKTNMLVEKDNLSYNINKRFKEKELSSITMCDEGDKCYEFKYSDDTSDKLVYSNTDKSITFNNYTFDIIDGITVEEPTITEHYDTMSSTTYNGYFIIHIPIKLDDKDYSIKINKHFNTDSLVIDFRESVFDKSGNRYILVEYLESTGKEYINTEYYCTSNTLINMNLAMVSIEGDQKIFGSYGSGGVCLGTLYSKWRFGPSMWAKNEGNVTLDKTSIIIESNKYTFNDEVYTLPATYSIKANNQYPIVVFGIAYNGKLISKERIKLYDLKLYDGDTLVRDYIPVIDSSSRPCLFDKVEKKCYYNQGTGEFLYG